MDETQDKYRQGPRNSNYDTLTHPDSIRVLTLFPATDSDAELEGDLNETRLSDELDVGEGYTALSYVWGTVHESHTLKLSKGTIAIGTNLDHALRDLRLFKQPCRIWVDAICIYQADLEERNHQVQQMRDIYAAARNTVIYLGQQGSNTCLSAWNFLERNSSWAWNHDLEVDATIPSTIDERLTSFRGELADVENDVLVRSWFRRLWVLQEAVVSHRLSIQCGRRRISWDDFCRILLDSPRYHDRYGFSLANRTRYEVVRDMHLTRCEYLKAHNLISYLPEWRLQSTIHRENWLDLLNMLERGRSMEASDPRDKIYGLLGIFNGIDITQPGFEIDYRESWQQVYTRFARNIIEVTGRYDVLSYVLPRMVDSSELKLATSPLPSWVPDWNPPMYLETKTRTILSTLVSNIPEGSQTENNAGGPRAAWINDGTALILPGHILGQIGSLAWKSVALLGIDEVAFQALRDGIPDEQAKRRAIMTRWDALVREIDHYFSYSLRFGSRGAVRVWMPQQENWFTPIDPNINHLAFCSDADDFRVCFDSDNITIPTSVESHLYNRSRQTATLSSSSNIGASGVVDWDNRVEEWTNPRSMWMSHVVDHESIIDGRTLGMCRIIGAELSSSSSSSSKDRAWCLVPRSAEHDFIVHFSGCRVPFVVRILNSPPSATPRWKIIGECVLNGYEELVRAHVQGGDRDIFHIH